MKSRTIADRIRAGHRALAAPWLRPVLPMLASAVIVVAMLPSPSRAQAIDPDTLAAATELMGMLSGDTTRQMVQQMSDGFWPTLESQLRSLHLDDATISDIRVEMDRILLEYVTNLMQVAPALYAKHFTADEIRQMIVFYRTPVGLKTLSEIPAVGRDLGLLLAPQLPALQADVKTAVAGVLHEHGYGN